MIEHISFNTFAERFKALRPDNFSYEGLKALYNYLIDYEEETGQEIEFDVIGLCCDYVEYKDIKEFQQDYNNDYKTIEDVEAETTVIMIDDESFIIQVF
jgi:CO dehydrogenase/acetyl-CoA synthase alpha subunit